MKKTVNHYWTEIFEKYDIVNRISSEGHFFISADQIKQYKEPRLMTKFDHSISRPEIFRKHNYSILPVDNGQYVIGQFDLYQKLTKNEIVPKRVSIPEFIESIDPENIYSESNALNVAMLSGMLEDLIGEDLYETVTGRMRSSAFDFIVKSGESEESIKVEKPQIEVDGGYESQSKLIMVEAKNSEPDDFIIRQLYYPYRFWKTKIEKEIVPVFFTYKNGVYTFYVYRFEDDNHYNSIKLVRKISYVVDYVKKDVINLSSIKQVEESKDVPFPQADTFNRVKEIPQLIEDDYKTAQEIAEFYNITPRQGSYYLAAAMYLGLIDKAKEYQTTALTAELSILDFKHKNSVLAQLILSHTPFYRTMQYYLSHGLLPTTEIIVKFMLESNINISGNRTVLVRRASTVKGWIQWILNAGVEVKE